MFEAAREKCTKSLKINTIRISCKTHLTVVAARFPNNFQYIGTRLRRTQCLILRPRSQGYDHAVFVGSLMMVCRNTTRVEIDAITVD